MGPIELAFISLWILFGIIGVVRGYPRELGVTVMLLIALFVTEIIDERFQARFNQFLSIFVGTDPAAQTTARILIYCAFLIVMAFIAYEGDTLIFRGQRGQTFIDLISGLLNGYFLVGSVWYYLQSAGYPIVGLTPPTSAFYNTIINWLPPPVFTWPILIGLAILMLIARFWK